MAGIRETIAARLAQRPPLLTPETPNPAAVLVPIVTRAEPGVLLTRRTDGLPRHAGQICFPGGNIEAGDATPAATALRETEEETGIGRDAIAVAGFLDLYHTNTGYTVFPVVGFIEEGFALRPNDREVAEIFEVPLAYLLDPRNRESAGGGARRRYAIQYGSHTIWGATAGMIVRLSERLGGR